MRINLFGGPGVGKSTLAGWLFYELKHRRFNIEIVTEYVKHWVYAGKEIKDFDQVYLFAKQQQEELRFLNHGVEHIITDSPVLLPAIYADLSPYKGNRDVALDIISMSQKYDQIFPSFNIFLTRKPEIYIEKGRYQDLKGAIAVDELMFKCYDPNKDFMGNYEDKKAILDAVICKLEGN